MENILINADDFGLKESVNKAIVDSFARGFINSTTIMSNMPFFEDAVELAYKHKITDKIGVHLNLDEGNLLTSEILKSGLFGKKNIIGKLDSRNKLFFITKTEKGLIYKEFASQIELIKKAGIVITHIDTHHHIHEIWPITQVLLVLLKEYNISSMRILNNLNVSTRFYKTGYRKIINKFIKKNRVNLSDYFGNQIEVIKLLQMNKSIVNDNKIEIMVHPDYNEKGILIDKIGSMDYSFEFSEDLLKLFSSNQES